MQHLIRYLRSFLRVLRGLPANLAPLDGMTVGPDDLAIARHYLDKQNEWYDPDIVASYEIAFASWNESLAAVAFMGGRVALSACIYALGLKKGDTALIPGYTCIVVPNAFHFEGIRVVYVDIETETYGLDIGDLRRKYAAHPEAKALALQHLFGLVCRDYEAILAFAAARQLPVIEDCSHATGARFRGRRIGNGGALAFYSSEQSKVFNTGNGGMAVTNDTQLAARLRAYRDQAPYPDAERTRKLLRTFVYNYYTQSHSLRWLCWPFWWLWYRHERLVSTTAGELAGQKPAHYGQKMPAPLAAIGLNQLAKLDAVNARRRQQAARWDQWCMEKGFQKPLVISESEPVFLRYPVMVDPEMKHNTRWAAEMGIELGVWFLTHTHPAPCEVADCPAADKAVAQCINLPTGA